GAGRVSRTARIAGAALLAVAASAASGQALPAVEQITWLSGDTQAQRVGDRAERPSERLVNWLAKQLPDIEHRRVLANAKRSW
ncbi:hypothetical protein ACXWO6_09865, partial [Streptococcus pyogenes]